MRFFTVCILSLALWGCHKKDKTAPLLAANLWNNTAQPFSYLDTLYIQSESWAQDEYGLQSIQFTVQDLNAKVWMQKSILFSDHTSAWSGITGLPLSNRYMPSGDYFVKIVLSDGTHETIEILSFDYIECPISRTHLFFSSTLLHNELENWMGPNPPISWNLNSELEPQFADPYHQLVWASHSTSPLVQAYSPMGNSPEWVVSTSSLSSIVQMLPDPQHLGAWILSDDGGIELINEKGIRIKNAIEIHTKKLAIYKSFMAMSQRNPGSPEQVVIKNKSTWGHHHTWVHGKNAIDIFAWSNYVGIVYLENNAYKISLLNMENLLPVNWHPLQLESWNSAPQILVNNDELWVAGDGQIVAYEPGGGIIMGPHNSSPTFWIKSNYDQSLWTIENGFAQQLNPTTGQVVWSSPNGSYHRILEMTNK